MNLAGAAVLVGLLCAAAAAGPAGWFIVMGALAALWHSS